MPEAPEVDLDVYLPVVREQIGDALSRLERKPDSAENNGRLGMLFQIYKDYPRAETFYARARAIDPDDPRWAYHHGQMLEQIGDLSGAIEALAVAAERREQDPAVQGHYADVLLNSQAAAQGRAIYERLARTYPELPHVQFGLGRARAFSGDHEGAVQAFERAIEVGGHFGAAYYALANAYQQLGNAEAAQRNFELFEAHGNRTPLKASEFDRDLQALDVSDQPHMRRGNALLAAGKPLEAIESFEAAVLVNPDNVSAHTTLVGVYAQTKQPELAEQHFAKAQALDPLRPKLHYNLALLRWQQGRRAEAASALREATRLDPHDPDAWTQLGQVKEALLDRGAAESAYRQALSVSPAHGEARFLLGRSLLDRDAVDEAIAVLEQFLVGPPAPRVARVRLLAKAHAAAGNATNAIAVLDSALEALDPARDAALRSELRRDRERLLDAVNSGDDQSGSDTPPPTETPGKQRSQAGARHGVAS